MQAMATLPRTRVDRCASVPQGEGRWNRLAHGDAILVLRVVLNGLFSEQTTQCDADVAGGSMVVELAKTQRLHLVGEDALSEVRWIEGPSCALL
jgi:hypothetical protein